MFPSAANTGLQSGEEADRGGTCAGTGVVGGGGYGSGMSRFRLLPTPEQEAGMLALCRDARFLWNLAVKQQAHWQPGRKAPGYVEQTLERTT